MGLVIWFTGLSGSGKTTLAQALCECLEKVGKRGFILDGDEVRKRHTGHLSFSREDISRNNMFIAQLAKEKSEAYDFVLISVIAPHQKDRELSHKILGARYIEVFVDCPLETCLKRDVKGLYKKARIGEMDNLIGIGKENPYEKPVNPDITIKTNIMSVEESIEMLIKFLQTRKVLV